MLLVNVIQIIHDLNSKFSAKLISLKLHTGGYAKIDALVKEASLTGDYIPFINKITSKNSMQKMLSNSKQNESRSMISKY